MKHITTGFIINCVLLAVILGMGGKIIFDNVQIKRAAKMLGNDAFREKMKKAQIVDIREASEYRATHIMGARSLPYATIKETVKSLRKDQPILLYDNDRRMVGRVAILLKKQGYTDIFILKTGFKGWDGKVKKK